MSASRNPVVLFVCSQNSARSQMAEGYLRFRAGDCFEVHSAGMEPGNLNPFAVEVMAEIGVDISSQYAKGVREYLGRLLVHHLVIVCGKAAENCPRIWPNLVERHVWLFDDPAAVTGPEEAKRQAFRDVRDQICARIDRWLEEMGMESKPHKSAPVEGSS